jgi:AraC-like DNA-binding protein
LDRAGELLIMDGLTVSEVAKEVGYTSLSHFITEFKRYFGTTPRGYASLQRETVALRVGEATAAVAAGRGQVSSERVVDSGG